MIAQNLMVVATQFIEPTVNWCYTRQFV